MPGEPRQISPANAWCLTLNNWTAADYEFLSSEFSKDDQKYFIIGKEIGKKSKIPHLQGYVCSIDPKKKFRPLPKYAIMRDGKQATHWERARKGREANYIYCSKDGDFEGNLPAVQKTKTLDEVLQSLEETFNKPIDYSNPNSEEIHKAQKEKEEAAMAFLTLKGEL